MREWLRRWYYQKEATPDDLKRLLLHIINILENKIMPSMQDVLADVADEKTIVASIGTAMDGLSQQLKDALANGNNPADIQAVIDGIDQNKQNLAAALLRNTKAAPTEPTPAPDPAPPASTDSGSTGGAPPATQN